MELGKGELAALRLWEALLLWLLHDEGKLLNWTCEVLLMLSLGDWGDESSLVLIFIALSMSVVGCLNRHQVLLRQDFLKIVNFLLLKALLLRLLQELLEMSNDRVVDNNLLWLSNALGSLL